jgi:hypothetical protein
MSTEQKNINAFISGSISGCIFTILSHPFHTLTTRYNREIILQKIKPSISNSIKYTVLILKTDKLSNLLKGITIRTLQGSLTYSFLFLSREYFNNKITIQNQTVKNISISACSGYVENIIIRQPFLTITSGYINNDKIWNSSLWLNVVKSYPLTSLFRSIYFTSSTIGRHIGTNIENNCGINNKFISGLFGVGFCIHFNGFSEIFTNELTRGKTITYCFIEGIKASKNTLKDLNLISRESLFLFPFLFPIDLQLKIK